jgi:hypothetical protein
LRDPVNQHTFEVQGFHGFPHLKQSFRNPGCKVSQLAKVSPPRAHPSANTL